MISLVITTKNDPHGLSRLLNSLTHQTTKPTQIIITEAGEHKTTKQIIKPYIKSLQITLIETLGANRSTGRNIAIQKAKYSLIVVTDAGCEAKPDWLEKITEPLVKRKADVVAGFYRATGSTFFAQCLIPFVAVLPDQLKKDTYLPSSRSLAFTKDAWRKVGGYPENLDYCEDLIFARNLKARTTLTVEPNAIVIWPQTTSPIKYFKQIFHYATGDVQAGYTPHLKKIAIKFLLYGLFLFFPFVFLLYLTWPIKKHYRRINHPLAIIYLPLIQLETDVAILAGTIYSLLK